MKSRILKTLSNRQSNYCCWVDLGRLPDTNRPLGFVGLASSAYYNHIRRKGNPKPAFNTKRGRKIPGYSLKPEQTIN